MRTQRNLGMLFMFFGAVIEETHKQERKKEYNDAPPDVKPAIVTSSTLCFTSCFHDLGPAGQLGMDEKEREEKVDFLSKGTGLGGGVGWILVLPWISEEARDLMGYVIRLLPRLYYKLSGLLASIFNGLVCFAHKCGSWMDGSR